MRLIIKDQKLMAISLFLTLHGIGIIENSFETMSKSEFIVGLILVLNAVGVLMEKRTFYISTMITATGFIVYCIGYIVYILFNDVHDKFPVILFLSIFIFIYGAIFRYLKTKCSERGF
jgi:hypothetical protein